MTVLATNTLGESVPISESFIYEIVTEHLLGTNTFGSINKEDRQGPLPPGADVLAGERDNKKENC